MEADLPDPSDEVRLSCPGSPFASPFNVSTAWPLSVARRDDVNHPVHHPTAVGQVRTATTSPTSTSVAAVSRASTREPVVMVGLIEPEVTTSGRMPSTEQTANATKQSTPSTAPAVSAVLQTDEADRRRRWLMARHLDRGQVEDHRCGLPCSPLGAALLSCDQADEWHRSLVSADVRRERIARLEWSIVRRQCNRPECAARAVPRLPQPVFEPVRSVVSRWHLQTGTPREVRVLSVDWTVALNRSGAVPEFRTTNEAATLSPGPGR